MMIRLGIPSKGRLMDQTFGWFSERGINLVRSDSDREYAGRIDGIKGVQLIFLSANEIPRELSSGRLHFGVTGTDLIKEKLARFSRLVEPISELGFGFANLIIAVPGFWIDVDSLDDLDAVSAQFREKNGYRLRIATKYHRLLREFLIKAGVADYQIVDSQGATEGAVKNGLAEAIADITSTGDTLKANHLKILSDGVILKSQATLFKSLVANLSEEEDQVANLLLKKLETGN
ncbi:ATP phosphoribosyltransferase [Paracoccaceae bacterium]|nr:ATP phosphoribosyltransferase [Paracoccaceae bacterium]MDG0987719.1 ATP phosphoribosyltransferase [Paracoccaceae bacterium]MDG1677046.1 ATP phosphoribosyltransferase [Paracoccaceae bacterium]MDG2249039.1 ATP phosphoribosyltransferase [Paracoccaceae bacterium]